MRHHLRLAAVLLFAAAGARAGGQFVGLPSTGQLDPQRVLSNRYGKDQPPAAQAAVAPAAPAVDSGPKVNLVPHGFDGGITGVAIDSTSDVAQERVPVSFGQVFAVGDLPATDGLVGRLADGATLPLQVDVKARHPDGSVRHAVISAVLPALAPHQTLMLTLARDKAPDAAGRAAASPATLLDKGFQACVSASVEGKVYAACADKLLAARPAANWLSGPVCNEWLVSAPLADSHGAEHPHLSARFAVRWYPEARRARVDVSVEDDWAYAPNPRNVTYDARITVGGNEVFAQHALEHLQAARWRKLFWWGQKPALEIRHDSAYLIASRALPNYDTSVAIPETAIAALAANWSGAPVAPMGPGASIPYMWAVGGRSDIGLLPSWAAIYLLSMDPRAGRVTRDTADLAGSWPIHYRDRKTDGPVSLLDHPMVALPSASTPDALPACAASHACDAPYGPDVAHQPNLAYLPYLLSGDRYDLDELQFWAAWDVLAAAPRERDGGKGLLRSETVSGQAWGLRALGEAAYITPDDDRLKAYFTGLVKNNLDWYNEHYTDRHGAGGLGALVHGNAIAARNGTALEPWQDDFFTAVVGHLAELGFDDARRLLAWKARFPVARMGERDACWIFGAASELTVRRAREAPVFIRMAEAYAASHAAEIRALPCASLDMARALQLEPGEMAGFSTSPSSFVANLQPALAYAADVAGQSGKDAWRRFMSRSARADYGSEPQFAIVPRRDAH